MPETTNRDSAERARKALMAYSDHVAGSPEEIAADLVCDILHLMRRSHVLVGRMDRERWLIGRLNVHELELTERKEG